MLLATPFTTVDLSLNRVHAKEQVLAADQSCSQIQALVAGAQLPVLAGAPQEHPLAWISQGLQQQREAGQLIRTLHLIAHGRPGAFRIGNVWIDAEALKAHAAELAHWNLETIALWSCQFGADADVVALLAELSGAHVLASADWLGRCEDDAQIKLQEYLLSDLFLDEFWPESFSLGVRESDEIFSSDCGEPVENCYSLSDDGYLGYAVKSKPTIAENWFTYSELGIESIGIQIVGRDKVGQNCDHIPQGWSEKAHSIKGGNSVPVVLTLNYAAGLPSEYQLRGLLEHKFKHASSADGSSQQQLIYPYFYLVEAVDSGGNVFYEDIDIAGANDGGNSYTLVNPDVSDLSGAGDSIILLHLDGLEFGPGYGVIQGADFPAAEEVPVEKRSYKPGNNGHRPAGGGSGDHVRLKEICHEFADDLDLFITATAASENEETAPLTDASFAFKVTAVKDNGDPESLK